MIAQFLQRTNLRNEPSIKGDVLQLMPIGATAAIIRNVKIVNADMFDWYYMRSSYGISGWCARKISDSYILFQLKDSIRIELDNFSDLHLLALMIAGETSDQSLTGQTACACVAVERLLLQRLHYGLTLWEVLTKPYQFSTLNSNHWRSFIGTSSKFNLLAELAVEGLLKSPYPTATHYCRYDLNPLPIWTQEQYSDFLGRINDHLFYYER